MLTQGVEPPVASGVTTLVPGSWGGQRSQERGRGAAVVKRVPSRLWARVLDQLIWKYVDILKSIRPNHQVPMDLSPVETPRKSPWDHHEECRGPQTGLSPFGLCRVSESGSRALELRRLLKG